MPTIYIQNLISFLNLGMVGFVTSAVAVRFVFPAVSLEGESFWIIRSSPLPLKDFLWAKFWSSVLPLLVLAEVLIVLSNILLKVSGLMMVIGVVTVFLMTFGITALGVGMGAVFPRFRYENVAQIPTGFGGIAYMIVTMLFIGIGHHARGMARVPHIPGPDPSGSAAWGPPNGPGSPLPSCWSLL